MTATLISTSSEAQQPTKSRTRGLSNFVSGIKRKKTPSYDSNDQQQHGGYRPSDGLPPPPPPKDADLGSYLHAKPRSHTVSGYEATSHSLDPSTPISGLPHHLPHPNQDHIYEQRSPVGHNRSKTVPSINMQDPGLVPAPAITPLDSSFDLSESYHIVPRPMQEPVHIVPRAVIPAYPRDPQERARLRLEAQRQREKEDEEIMRAEAERQARIQAEKERILREEEEAAERQKIRLNREVQLALARKQRSEYFKKAEAEKQRILLEERRQLARQRRAEESRKLEEWRREQALKSEEIRVAAERARREEEQERKSKLIQAKQVLKDAEAPSTMGWVTVQQDESLIWRRRYFKKVDSSLLLYKASDASDALDTLNLRGNVSRVCEWSEGYEELKALPTSFAVEFKDGHVWSMFTDTEDEKYMLVALIQHTAGL